MYAAIYGNIYIPSIYTLYVAIYIYQHHGSVMGKDSTIWWFSTLRHGLLMALIDIRHGKSVLKYGWIFHGELLNNR